MSNTPETELRSTPRPVEIRSGSRRIGGLAAVYSKPSRQMGAFVEIIEPRAWAQSAGNGFPNVAAYREHKPELLLGTVDAGTLTISDTKEGLDYTINLGDTTAANDTLADVLAGNLKGSSVSMRVHQDEFTHDRSFGGLPVRHVVSAELVELSVVSNPAYLDAHVGLRSFATHVGADPADVIADVNAGVDLRRYLERTDNAVTPLAAATIAERRSGGDIELQRRRLESEAKRIQMDTGRRPDEKPQMSTAQRLLELRRKRNSWDQPLVEARSYGADLDRFGNPARRNSNGHAID